MGLLCLFIIKISKEKKKNKKQMAYVGAVYTIDRFRRTADDVIDELRLLERMTLGIPRARSGGSK